MSLVIASLIGFGLGTVFGLVLRRESAPVEVVTEIKAHAVNGGSVVEADTAAQWAPKQRGGVVVAEPKLLAMARRNGENVDEL